MRRLTRDQAERVCQTLRYDLGVEDASALEHFVAAATAQDGFTLHGFIGYPKTHKLEYVLDSSLNLLVLNGPGGGLLEEIAAARASLKLLLEDVLAGERPAFRPTPRLRPSGLALRLA